MNNYAKVAVIASLALVAACGPSRDEIRKEIEIKLRAEAAEAQTVEVIKEVQKPCPGKVPARPKKMEDLPTDAMQLIAALGAKLKEYAGEGMYADKAQLYFKTCPPGND